MVDWDTTIEPYVGTFVRFLRKKGLKIIEVPTTWEDKKDSKLNIVKVPIEMFSGVLRLRLINSPFCSIVKAYDLLPEKFKFHV